MLNALTAPQLTGNNVDENKIFENKIACEWLSTKQAADFLSMTENALRIMVYRNQINVYRVGRRLRFSIKECRSLFEKKEK